MFDFCTYHIALLRTFSCASRNTAFETRLITCQSMKTNAILQLHASGIRTFDGAKKLSTQAARFWFSGLFFNVVAGFYTLYQLKQRSAALDKRDAEKAVESKKIERYSTLHGRCSQHLTNTSQGMERHIAAAHF